MKLSEMTKLEGGRYRGEDGLILPWYTSPCLEWLMTLDLNGSKVFEYGAGDSTEWYRSRGAKVMGVDNNPKYADNQRGIFMSSLKEDYVGMVWACSQWQDLIIIDGIWRDECTEHALDNLIQGGYLIIDNYMQPSVEMEWSRTNELIKGMEQILYKEPDHYDWQTLVVKKPL